MAPRLDRALKKIAKRGGEVVLIDGTLIPTTRRTGTANRLNCPGTHHRHGLRFLAITDDRGRLIWISAARPGRTRDPTAARHDKMVERLTDDQEHRQPPTTWTSTPHEDHATPLTCMFKMAQAQYCTGARSATTNTARLPPPPAPTGR
nr:transposase family protein [Streptomyces exfoliatus]